MDLLDRLLGHDAWTAARLIWQSHGLTDAQLDQEFDLGWRTVRATLGHIVGNMEAWTDLMNGGPLRARPEPEGSGSPWTGWSSGSGSSLPNWPSWPAVFRPRGGWTSAGPSARSR